MLQFDIENKSIWEALQNTKDPIIMYGTGNGADKVFEVFKELNISVTGVTASDGFVRERYFHDFRVTPISEFFEKYRDNTAADVSNAVNNTYLVLQGTEGSKSYGMVVDLTVAYYKSLGLVE